jgi:translation initiation factor IF-2
MISPKRKSLLKTSKAFERERLIKMSTIRIHELAKALGQSSKILMNELASGGFEYKTHMATLEAGAIEHLAKKNKGVKDLITQLEAAKAEAPKPAPKPKAKATAGSKLVTSRSKTAKKSQASEPAVEAAQKKPEIEIVQVDSGTLEGTVTLEQKVVKSGIIRRRRVDPSTVVVPPSVEPTEEVASPVEPSHVEMEPEGELEAEGAINEVASVQEELLVEEPQAAELPVEVAQEPVSEPVVEAMAAPEVQESPQNTEVTKKPEEDPTPAPAAKKEEVTVEAPRPASRPIVRSFMPAATGRNLSAPSRLRVVETPAMPPPRPAAPSRPGAAGQRPAPGAPAAATRSGPAGASAPRMTAAEAELQRKKDILAKKKPGAVRTEEDVRALTKKDLLGMVEEVEITRPLGRRTKKVQIRHEKRQTQITTPGASKRKIRIHDEITVSDLADQMGIKGVDLVRKLMSMGQMVSLQHKLDFDTATLIAGDYKYEVVNVAESAETLLQEQHDLTEDANAETRAPIVTIMGHVDHGKTSLLDYIRRSRVAAGEAGGITQHIGAYKITHAGKPITFLDTPGHAAFTSMRARGASVTDIVILVVAADEGVKPQTTEALAHAQQAGVPIIVAVNKIDKPEAKPEVVIQELSGKGLVPEAWGGDTMYVNLSALTGQGVDDLLERILIQAEVLELRSAVDRPARGVVIESRLDKGKGPVATVMIQSGTLKQGSPIVSGSSFGKVRAMFDDQGQQVKEVGPSTPVEILGFDNVPEVGETVQGVNEDAVARKASDLAQQAKKRADALKHQRVSLEEMYKKMQAGEMSDLRVILKGDVQGSVEAISDSLEKVTHEKVKVSVIYKAVGGITESDVDLAAASGAIIFGFNVRPTAQAKNLAHREGVQIKAYEIIYELLDEVKLAMQGLLAPIIKEQVIGQAEVREVFNVSKVGPIAGCFLKQGKFHRNAQVRVIRDSVVIYTAKIAGLRRFKDDVKEVAEGYECGIRVENFSDLKPGDILEAFETIEEKAAVG